MKDMDRRGAVIQFNDSCTASACDIGASGFDFRGQVKPKTFKLVGVSTHATGWAKDTS